MQQMAWVVLASLGPGCLGERTDLSGLESKPVLSGGKPAMGLGPITLTLFRCSRLGEASNLLVRRWRLRPLGLERQESTVRELPLLGKSRNLRGIAEAWDTPCWQKYERKECSLAFTPTS